VENVILSDKKNDPTTQLDFDEEQKCMDDNDIMGVYSVGDDAYTSAISWLIRRLVEK